MNSDAFFTFSAIGDLFRQVGSGSCSRAAGSRRVAFRSRCWFVPLVGDSGGVARSFAPAAHAAACRRMLHCNWTQCALAVRLSAAAAPFWCRFSEA